ncbi:MAG: hypothetical protein R3247_00840 [Rhodothermales bacterium]|nr:hypothetical protein [Rhodothermales bacterium]
MVDKLVIWVCCMALVAAALESVGRLRTRRSAEPSPEEPADAPSDERFETAFRTIVRLLASAFFGLVLGGVTAGILEELDGVGEIAFFSVEANLLIGFWAAAVWWYVTRRDLL